MSTADLYIFEEFFYRDLESWFSANIACCDHCYDDFLSFWPLANHADEFRFQTQHIGLDAFYSGSRLKDHYTEAEFKNFIRQIPCPRCGDPLGGNIWTYELPFNVPRDFEKIIHDVGLLAASTPFLLLTHDFCQKVLTSIRSLSQKVTPAKITTPLFRARSLNTYDLPETMATFDFPPPSKVQEGRYNHAGSPVLYLASDAKTCHAELRGKQCLALELKLRPAIRVLDLIEPYSADEDHAELLNCLVYSALISAKQSDQGWHKPHYVFSRFISDCARAAGFDAIKYPSTRMTSTNFNLAIVNTSLVLATNADVVTYHRILADDTGNPFSLSFSGIAFLWKGFKRIVWHALNKMKGIYGANEEERRQPVKHMSKKRGTSQ